MGTGTGVPWGQQRGWLFRINLDGVYTALTTERQAPTLIKGLDDAFYGYGRFILSDQSTRSSYYKLDPADGYSQMHWLDNDWITMVSANPEWITHFSGTIRKLELVKASPESSLLTTDQVTLMNLDEVGATNSVINHLVRGRDGVYYGSASGGELGFGMVFSFELSPRVSLGERRRELFHLVARGKGTACGERLARALADLDAALDPACWMDDDYVTRKEGPRVFRNLRDTLRRLEAAAKHNASAVSNDSIMICIERVSKASETLIRLQNQ